MKVLQRNEELAPAHWSAQVCCGKCESILEVGKEDLRRYSFVVRFAPSIIVWFPCGVCETPNTITVPFLVKKRLKTNTFPQSRPVASKVYTPKEKLPGVE